MRFSFQFGAILALLATLGVFGAGPAFAQQSGGESGQSPASASKPTGKSGGGQSVRTDGEVSNVVQELSQEIYSPFCPGKTLAMCPSGGAARVRRHIQEMARDGKPKPAIKESIIDKFGEEFRFEEPPPSDNIPLIVLLSAGLLVCAGTVWYLAKRRDDGEEEELAAMDEELSEEDEYYLDEIRNEYRE